MRISKPNTGAKIDNRTIAKNSKGNIVNLEDFKLDKAIKFYERFSFHFSKYPGGKAHLTWGVNASDYLKRYSNGISGKYRLTSKLFTNEELNSFINEHGQGCFLTWYLEVTSKYTTYPVFVVEKEFNCDLPRTLEGESGKFLPLASARLFMNENNELDEYNTQVFRFYENSIPNEVFVRPYYWEYKNYQEMTFHYTNIPSGQIARVLDNSDAPDPSEGWATYQQDYNNLVNKGFKLVSRQHNGYKPDQLSIGLNAESKLTHFSEMNPFPANWKLTEDFDFAFDNSSISGKPTLWIKINDLNRRNYSKDFIHILTPKVKFFKIGEGYAQHEAVTEDTDCYWTLYTAITDEYTSASGLVCVARPDATGFQEITKETRHNGILYPIAQVKATLKADTNTFDVDSCLVIKHWKNVLKQDNYLDNETIRVTADNHLFVPEHHNPLKNGYLLEDFDFEIEKVEGANSIQLKLIGGESRRNIPVQTSAGIRWFGIGTPTFNLDTASNKIAGTHYHWDIAFKLLDDENGTFNGWVTYYGGASSTFDVKRPYDPATSSNIILLSVTCPVPRAGIDLQQEDFKLYKYWKNCLAPAEKRLNLNGTPTDGLTVEPVYDDKLRVLTAYENSRYVKIMEDFNMKADYSSVVKQIKVYLDPYPEMKNIPAKRYSGDRTFGVKNVNISIGVWANLIQGKTMYVAVYSPLVTDGSNGMTYKVGLGKMPDLSGIDWLENVLLGFVKLPIPDDISNADQSKLVFHKIYKKALAPIQEINDFGTEVAVDYGDMNAKRPALSNGQLVKCTDASADSQVSSGWAYYRFRKESNDFELVSKEKQDAQQANVEVDQYTVEKNYTGEIAVPALQIGHHANTFLLKDFDFNVSFSDSDTIELTPRGGNQALPILVNGVRKYMRVAYWTLKKSSFGSDMTGKWVYWMVQADIEDTEVTSGGMQTHAQADGSFQQFNAEDMISHVPVLTVRAYIPDTSKGEKWDLSKVYMYKHWKAMLAPFDELWNEKVTP
ncbi:hypothetical protein [Marinifilum sp. D737]|uniref:hypothetical protein n=1 Tax=Marinifilum sp. D737 TaxID=2969628 RepID=UPI00227262AF|nr:hypothetical protein [Marinifilum sp. D737]MCY1634875.1 hypothetical protein [Marinifilum sp. D737]